MDLDALPLRTGRARVLALSGSLRAASSNTRLLQLAIALAPDTMTVTLFRGLGDLPHFNPDLDDDALRPAAVRAFRAAIAAADALLISSPEYAHGVPGTLKNALDWLVSGPEFPAILIGLFAPSPYATHATSSLRDTLVTMSAELLASASVTVPLAGRPADVSALLMEPAVTAPVRLVLNALANDIARARHEHRRLVPTRPV
jgi:NAD(P)H-dependent FMN reductase